MPSSVIQSFAYDPDSLRLDIRFTTGRRYRYFAVPAEVATALRLAPSKGRYFNDAIRDRFECRRPGLTAATPSKRVVPPRPAC